MGINAPYPGIKTDRWQTLEGVLAAVATDTVKGSTTTMLLMSETAVFDPGFERIDQWLATSNSIETWDASDGNDRADAEPFPAPERRRSVYRACFVKLRMALADVFEPVCRSGSTATAA